MKVKFKYDFGSIHLAQIREMQSNASEEDIIAMYHYVMFGMDYGNFSSYEIIKEE